MPARYVPALKAKQAEFSALAELDPVTKERILPLLEVPPAPRDRDDPKIRRPLSEHLKPIAPKLAKSWGTTSPIMLDLPYLEPNAMLEDEHPATVLFTDAAELALQVVPVIGISATDTYTSAVATAAATFGRGAAIRLVDADLRDPRALDYKLRKLLATLLLEREEVDVVLDMKEISSRDVVTRSVGISSIIRRFPACGAWRTMTLLSGAFPQSLAGMRANNIRRVRRADWEIWRAVISAGVARPVMFGDYGIDNPAPFDAENPKTIVVSANIRYTSADVWLVVKGTSTKKDGWEQTMRLSQVLSGLPEFMGAGYSPGDTYISKRARGAVKCGNPTIWRRVGVTHHITMATAQAASYGVP